MSLYFKFKSKDRNALIDLAETMSKSLKGYNPNSNIAIVGGGITIVKGDTDETILCVEDYAAEDKTILIEDWNCK